MTEPTKRDLAKCLRALRQAWRIYKPTKNNRILKAIEGAGKDIRYSGQDS